MAFLLLLRMRLNRMVYLDELASTEKLAPLRSGNNC
jgi:hypothetical protein